MDALEVSDREELAEEVDLMLIASSSFILFTLSQYAPLLSHDKTDQDEVRPLLGIGLVFGLLISWDTPDDSEPESVLLCVDSPERLLDEGLAGKVGNKEDNEMRRLSAVTTSSSSDASAERVVWL